MFRCQAIENAQFCDQPATWIGRWSDRELMVCNDHRDYVREAHRGDHIYDQTGIEWVSDSGRHEYESREALNDHTS